MHKPIYFSGLNGIRAIASLAVLFAHTTSNLDQFGLNPFIIGMYPDGNPKSTLLAGFGVTMFFCLSGFLITYLLLQEKENGSINIKHFYMRRILRIWPLYYLYLIVSIITLLVFDLPFEHTNILYYIFLSANIPFTLGFSIKFLVHYWSLGVEEQFYSFWPWVVHKSKNILKSTIAICSLLILAKIIFRIIDIQTNNGNMSLLYQILNITKFDCMLIGAIAAILLFKKNELFLRLANNIITQLLCWIAIFLLAINEFHIASFIDSELISVVTACIIIGQIKQDSRIINLDIPILNFIGKISYGIYIINPLAIFYLSKIIVFTGIDGLFPYVVVYGSCYALTILLAYLSYAFFEKRFMTIKARYS
jgi:peptidoglycan/LPS O-acetylase OafA/YrhL